MNITQEVVALFVTVAGAIWGGYKWVESRVTRVEEKADSVRRDLEGHKVEVARDYVSKDGLRELRDEIRETRIELRADIKELDAKLDGRGEDKGKKGIVYG